MMYDIICYGSRQDVIDEVNKQIKLGWKPLGGISVGVSFVPEDSRGPAGEEYTFAQAMIKE